MGSEQFNPGDTVVPLGGLCITTSIIASAVIAGIVTWKVDGLWWQIILSILLGGSLGWLVGKSLAVLFYPNIGDDVLVVKVGVGAVSKTLFASLLGSVVAALVIGLGYAFIIGGLGFIKSISIHLIVTALVVGILWGLLSALA